MIEVKLHDIGEGMTQADINHFFVQPGDYVKADDPLVEVQTDKMTAEIPSPVSGTIKEIRVTVGSTIQVGTTVLLMESKSSSSATSEVEINKSVQPSKTKLPVKEASFVVSNRILASPYTRKIARDHNINIEEIKGSGPANRITDDDVYAIINGSAIAQTRDSEQVSSVRKSIPYKGIRKQIGNRLSQSLFTVPHCTHFEEVDVTELIQLREQMKRKDKSISATVFFMKALSICLKEFPLFNSSLDEEKEVILLHEHVHIGLATDTPEGLIVPVLKDVNEKSFSTLQEEMKSLIDKSMNRGLKSEDITGGTFTISNVGPLGGSTGATPILNMPEVALMAFHKTKKRPMVNEQDEIVIRSMMNISMTYDHRVVDGGSAVAFTNRFTELIEHPTLMLVELM